MGNESRQYTAVSLFAGCGGSDLGLLQAGIQPIWANDIDPAACELYPHITGLDIMHPGDVREVKRFPEADILAGCYPCQGYSQGGRRDGAAEINFLYREYERALRQVRPRAFIVENVDGMRFSQNLHLLGNQLRRFRLAGYRVEWQLLDAKEFGLAQDRRRLFIVGIRSAEEKRFSFPKPTHGAGRKPYRALRDVIWKYRHPQEGSYCPEPLTWYYLSRNRRRTWSKQSTCIVAHWRSVGLHPDSPPLKRIGPDKWEFTRPGSVRRFSFIECAALQGFPKPRAFKTGTIRQRFRAIGNAVPPPLFAAVAKELLRQLRNQGQPA